MRNICILILLFCSLRASAADGDSVRHVGFSFSLMPHWQIAMDQYERMWLQKKQGFAFGAELDFTSVPTDHDAFAEDYNYPTLSLGAMLSLNHGVTMRRTADHSWGKAQLVDYDSHLGNIFTIYGNFSRPLLRRGRWQLDYSLRAGIGYNSWYYNPHDNIDNELIGSALNIHFGAALMGYYNVTDDWALMGGLAYGHHSNGALARPNKGENHWGPVIGVRYRPYDKVIRNRPTAAAWLSDSVGKYPLSGRLRGPYLDFRLGIGGKTLLEDWQRTQYNTEPGEPDYRTDDFHFYMSYSASVAFMYRYARRWASGIGADVYYGTYYKHVRDLDEAAGISTKHSPWSIGISARHEVYYHNFSLDLALGIYLHRHMGSHAKEIEQPYYERVGVFYTFPKLGHLKVGASVQAHRTKADLTEVQVSIPVKL